MGSGLRGRAAPKTEGTLSHAENEAAKTRRLEAMAMQEIEGNPLSQDQVEMFEMFERERWSHERCLAYVLERAKQPGIPTPKR